MKTSPFSYILLVLLSFSCVLKAQSIQRVNLDSNGNEAIGGNSSSAQVNSQGEVVFHSSATNLIDNDTNGLTDVFLRNFHSNITILVSMPNEGGQGNGVSTGPSITDDGHFVSFNSLATNLVSPDTNTLFDVFVRDLSSGSNVIASLAASGEQAFGSSSLNPSTSLDGRYVVFNSGATNIIPGDTNNSFDVFVRDLLLNTTTQANLTLLNQNPSGIGCFTGNGSSISADGRHLVFISAATNMIPGYNNNIFQICVRDLLANITILVSTSAVGTLPAGNALSSSPVISANGRYIAFSSAATNLVANDTNLNTDIFVRDLISNTTVLVSVSNNDIQGNGSSSEPSISQFGRYIVFRSGASNLVSNDTNSFADIFVRDLLLNTTEILSRSSNGESASSFSDFPSISPNGRYVTFESGATNLVSNDTNLLKDIFLVDRGPGSIDSTTSNLDIISLSASSTSIIEGASVLLTINRQGTATNSTSIGYSISGTANVNDYTLTPVSPINLPANILSTNLVLTATTANPPGTTNNGTITVTLLPGSYTLSNNVATVTILPAGSPPPATSTYTSGDFTGDGSDDILAFKGGKNKGLRLLDITNASLQGNISINIPPKNKFLVGNRAGNLNYIVFKERKNIRVTSHQVSSTIDKGTDIFVGATPKKSGKPVASGDFNADGIIDLVSQKGKKAYVLIGPGYSTNNPIQGIGNKLPGRIVGMFTVSSVGNGITNTLVFQKGKSTPVAFNIDANANAIATTVVNPNAKILGMSGATPITQKGKVITTGAFIFTNTKTNNVGKVVGPK